VQHHREAGHGEFGSGWGEERLVDLIQRFVLTEFRWQ